MNFCENCGTKMQPLLRNRYRIIRPLGDGGFGRTFLAEDEDKLQDLCVVKQLAPQVQGTNALQKATLLFQEEARRLQQLGEHSQVPMLYAYFEQDGYLYLVQQLIVGQTLRQELEQQGIFNEQKIWQLLTDLLPVLQFIHSHHVIHRDIKPENIIRRSPQPRLPKGELVLIDFGVAKYFTTTAIAQPGTSIGSFGYAALEQMNSGEAYPSSDLYSLGVTCFHLLTRIHPSQLWAEQGYNWVTNWQQHLKFPISPKLAAVLDKLLQKDMQLRYRSADQVFQDLNEQTQPPILSSFAVTQPPQSAIGNSQGYEEAGTPTKTFEIQPKHSKRNPIFGLAPAKLFKNKLLVGSAVLLLGVAGYAYWQLADIPILIGHTGEVNSVAISPDGQKIASGSDDRTIKIWSLNRRKQLRTLKGHTSWVYSVAFSPDSQTLISGSKDKTVKIWNLKTGQELRSLTGHSSYVNSVAFSPDGQTIASGSYDKTIRLHLKTGQAIALTGHSREVLAVAFSSNGQYLVSSSADRTIKIWNPNTGKELRTLTGHSGDVNAIAISPDSQTLASVSDDKTVKVWNLNTGRELRTLIGYSSDINSVAFSPDGQAIATGSDDKTIKIWNIVTGEELTTLKGHLSPVFAVAFSPNGQLLVSGSADKTIKIWQTPH
jgi:serine/threonine protein kinase